MNLNSLISLAEGLPRRYLITDSSVGQNYVPRELSVPTEIQTRRTEKGLPELFKEHCAAQAHVLSALQKAFDLQQKKYPTVVQFVYGSVAKLEFISDISDIDILPILAPPPKKVGGSVTSDPGFAKYCSDLKRQLTRDLTKLGFGRIKIEVSGIPSGVREDFYQMSDLLERVGEANEPSWAITHRGSLLFECAYHPASEEASDKLREDIARSYHLASDLKKREFPFSAALLLNFVRLSGVISEVRVARALVGDDAASETATVPENGTIRPQEKIPTERRKNEILKALYGRTWNSIVHSVMLHTLYWLTRIETAATLGAIINSVNQAPALKLIDIADYVGQIRAELKYPKWFERNGIDKHAARKIKGLIDKVFDVVGPREDDTTDMAQSKPLPFADRYVRNLILASRGRQSSSDLSENEIHELSQWTDGLFDLLEGCERISLILIGKTTKKPVDLVKLFGREIFDRRLIKYHFAAEAPRRTPAANRPGVRSRRVTRRRRPASAKQPRGPGPGPGMSIPPA